MWMYFGVLFLESSDFSSWLPFLAWFYFYSLGLAISFGINFVRIVPMVRIFCLCVDFCLAFLKHFCFALCRHLFCLHSWDILLFFSLFWSLNKMGFLLFSRHICIQVSFETCRLIGFPLDYNLLTTVERLFVCPFKEFLVCPFGSRSVLTMIFWPLSSDLFSLHYDSRDFYFALWRRFCFAFLGLCSVLTMIFWPYLETFVSPLSRSF